jgi:microcystin-dependent protein
MNKFLPQTGGHPLHLDEFILMQDAYLDGFNALVRKLAPSGNMVIDGFHVDQSGPNVVYTSGWIAFNGEIYKVDSGTFPKDTLLTLYVKPVQTTIAPSPQTYEDTTSKAVHVQRKAILKYQAGDVDGIVYSALAYPGVVIEGGILPWYPPTGTAVTDYFDTTGLGIGKGFGYAICNGLNGTLDLRGMFIPMATTVPYSGGSSPLRAILSGTTASAGTEAGLGLVTLTTTQMPSHNHTITDSGHFHFCISGVDSGAAVGPTTYVSVGHSTGGNLGYGLTATGSVATGGKTDRKESGISLASAGSGGSHENRPPSFYVYYITRVR